MSNAQKTPLSRTLPAFVAKKIQDAISSQGKALPCHVLTVNGQIVNVNFDVPGITLPGDVPLAVATSVYIRLPIQEGDKGMCIPSDAYLGATTGLGAPTQTVTAQGNLANLAFMPIANANWSEVDPDALFLNGPNGVVTQDTEGKSVTTLTPDGITTTTQGTYDITADETASISADTSLTLTGGGHSIVISSAGVEIDGVLFLPHTHSGVDSGSDDSGPVVP